MYAFKHEQKKKEKIKSIPNNSESFAISKATKILSRTSGSSLGQLNVLGLVESWQSIVCDLEHPSCIYDAVSGRQVAVYAYRCAVQVLHALRILRCCCREREREIERLCAVCYTGRDWRACVPLYAQPSWSIRYIYATIGNRWYFEKGFWLCFVNEFFVDFLKFHGN